MRALSDESLADVAWEQREGWPDEWADDEGVKNASGELIAMRDDGLLMRTYATAGELEAGWHLMTAGEYEALIDFVGEDKVDPAHRRA